MPINFKALSDHGVFTDVVTSTLEVTNNVTVGRVVSKRGPIDITHPSFGASVDSLDNTAAINAAIAYAKANNGGDVLIPPLGIFKHQDTIIGDGCIAVNIRGESGPGSGAQAASNLQFTGASGVDAHSWQQSSGCSYRDLNIYDLLDGSGNVINLSGKSDGTNDTDSFRAIGVYIQGVTSGTTTRRLFLTDKANNTTWDSVHFQGGDIHIYGKSSGSYSNRGTILGSCQFSGANTKSILNPGDQWQASGVVEPLRNGGIGWVSFEVGVSTTGLVVVGLQTNDIGLGSAGGAYINWAGSGLVVIGSSFALADVGTGIILNGSFRGCVAKGNIWNGTAAATAFNLTSPGAAAIDLDLYGNDFPAGGVTPIVGLGSYVNDVLYGSNGRINIQGTLDMGTAGRVRFNNPRNFVDGDTTPDVSKGNIFATVNSGATSITNFTNGFNGQVIVIEFTDGNTTIKNGANIKLAGAADKIGTADDVITLALYGGVWHQMAPVSAN